MTDEIAELPLLAKPRVTDVRLVETVAQLSEAIKLLAASSGPFALDAERASGFKYSQRAYLIQVHRLQTPIFLIDPIAVLQEDENAIKPLAELLSSDEWILHAGLFACTMFMLFNQLLPAAARQACCGCSVS